MGILCDAVTDVDGEEGGDSDDDDEEECDDDEIADDVDDGDDEVVVAGGFDAGGCRVGVVLNQVGRCVGLTGDIETVVCAVDEVDDIEMGLYFCVVVVVVIAVVGFPVDDDCCG